MKIEYELFDTAGESIKSSDINFGNDNKKEQKTSKKFNASKETTTEKALRNIYKPIKETVNLGLGLPGDIYNIAASGRNVLGNLMGKMVDKTQLPGEDIPYLGKAISGINTFRRFLHPKEPQFPLVPEKYTGEGVKKNITNPIGEYLFGEGSMQPQQGYLEGSIDKASKWVPWTILNALTGGGASGAKIAGELGLNALQGMAGQVGENYGLGEVGQSLVEAGVGVGTPILGKLFGSYGKQTAKKVVTNLKDIEKTSWAKSTEKAVEVGKVGAKDLKTTLKSAEKEVVQSIAPKNRPSADTIINEISKDIKNNKIDSSSLINHATKINESYPTDSKNTRKVLKKVKESLYEAIDNNLGGIHKKARETTEILRSTPLFKDTLLEMQGKFPKGSANKVMDTAIILSRIASVPAIFGSPKVALGLFASTLLPKAFKNVQMVLSHPLMKKEAFKTAKEIAKKNILPATVNISKNLKGSDKPEKNLVKEYGIEFN